MPLPEEHHWWPVSVLVPAFGSVEVLRGCLESLAEHLPAGCDVFLLDDATPGGSIAQLAGEFAARIPTLHYVRRPKNLGFVANCNQAMMDLLDTGRDILLLNSDTRITAGAIEEMSAVLHLHEKHGAVTPRSNNATVFSVPVTRRIEAGESYELWQRIREFLPRYHVMPTCVGFCMLIRNIVLRHFGFFDAVFSPGYNEENDFMCRVNRHGYSSLAANQAFVFHLEAASFGDRRAALEIRNRALLDARYPEYSRIVNEYFRYLMDPVDRFAVLWSGRKKRILFDLHSFPPEHSGTSEFALSLLLHLAPLLEKYDLFVGLQAQSREFFAGALAGYRVFDEKNEEAAPFDLVFRPVQIFSWQELYRMAKLGARICYTHQDSIAVRCQYLSGAALRLLHRNLPQLTDRIVAISKSSRDDFELLHGQPAGRFEVIYQGTHATPPSGAPRDGHILIVGNRFHHKGVSQAVKRLRGLGRLAVLGGEPEGDEAAGVAWFVSGGLGTAEIAELFAKAAIVVYPSYYEGFGLPVLDSLALGRPVVAIDSGVNRELQILTRGDRNLRLIAAHDELAGAVSAILASAGAGGKPGPGALYRTWSEVALDYARVFEEMLGTELDPERLRFRWNWLAAMDAYCPLE
jgi:GT2 family glycosyltransferase